MRLLFTILLCGAARLLMAQEPVDNPTIPTFYWQIFLNDTAERVTDVFYLNDSTKLDYRLSPDGTAIYLLNYDGKRTVKAVVIFKGSTPPEDVVRPHCNIHGLEQL